MKHAQMWLVTAALAAAALVPVNTQEKIPFDSIPLRVQLVLSRFDGEKKLSSLPYTLHVNATKENLGRLGGVNMRMGVQVPIPSTTISKEGAPPMESYSYRDVGTNIDCYAFPLDDGRYRLHFTLTHNSIYSGDLQKAGGPRPIERAPMLRNFTSNFVVALRDGQTTQNTSATDPVSGEVLKVDVTMNVVK